MVKVIDWPRWERVQVKFESNWLSSDGGWILGYDTQLLEDMFGIFKEGWGVAVHRSKRRKAANLRY